MKSLNTISSGLAVACLLMVNADIIIAQGSAGASGAVRIGTQVWSVRNLDVSHFRNGDPIPEAKTAAAWVLAFDNLEPAWCYYENDSLFGTHYGMSSEDSRALGKLYNWFAVSDPRGLTPEGWHVPSFDEWETLTVYLGGAGGVAETAMMVVMDRPTSTRPQPGGTNSSGFTALPGGSRDLKGGFTGYGAYGYWWSTTKFDTGLPSFLAWYRMLRFFPSTRTLGDVFTS